MNLKGIWLDITSNMKNPSSMSQWQWQILWLVLSLSPWNFVLIASNTGLWGDRGSNKFPLTMFLKTHSLYQNIYKVLYLKCFFYSNYSHERMICFKLHILQHFEKLLITQNKTYSTSVSCTPFLSVGFKAKQDFKHKIFIKREKNGSLWRGTAITFLCSYIKCPSLAFQVPCAQPTYEFLISLLCSFRRGTVHMICECQGSQTVGYLLKFPGLCTSHHSISPPPNTMLSLTRSHYPYLLTLAVTDKWLTIPMSEACSAFFLHLFEKLNS